MYAIIVTGGKQYKVEVGSEIMVEKLDEQIGANVNFDVLMMADGENVQIGTPLLRAFLQRQRFSNTARAKRSLFSSISPKRIIARNRVIVSPTPRSRSFPSAER